MAGLRKIAMTCRAVGGLDGWEQFRPGDDSPAARHLIDGTVAMIAALPRSGSQLQSTEGISAQNLARLAASLRQQGS
jgi:hypothetical protein